MNALDRHRALLAAATPGKWFNERRWLRAGTHPPIDRSRPTCAYCHLGDPQRVTPYTEKEVREGQVDGGAWHAHLAEEGDDWRNDPHRIESEDGQLVAGNFDYEEGGIVNQPDAKLIVAAVNAHPLLLDLWAAAKKLDDVMDRREKLPDMEFDKLEGEMVETIQSVRDILAKLEAMQ